MKTSTLHRLYLFTWTLSRRDKTISKGNSENGEAGPDRKFSKGRR